MYLKQNMTLKVFVKYLNENKKKKTCNNFTNSDVQAYCRRGYLPNYLGRNEIEVNKEIEGIVLYNLKE